jgi:hypothetical protein
VVEAVGADAAAAVARSVRPPGPSTPALPHLRAHPAKALRVVGAALAEAVEEVARRLCPKT